MLGTASAIAFLPSVDLDRAQRFFAGRLGLTVEEITPFACVLRAGTTMLRITKVDTLQPQPFTVFGWQVPNIQATTASLAAAGIACLRYDGMDQDEAGVWRTPNGDLVAWFQDPDGNTLSLTQLTDR